MIRRRQAYETDTAAFMKRWRAADTRLRNRILKARARLGAVATPDEALRDSSALCLSLGADGLRGELILLRAARALAAFDDADTVGRAQLRRLAPLALSHRLRRDPLDEAGSTARVSRAVSEAFGTFHTAAE